MRVETKKRLSLRVQFISAIILTLGTGVAFAMPAIGHINGTVDYPGMKALLGTSPESGGAGPMKIERLRSLTRYMDEPSTQTGKYINQKTGGVLLTPSNH